MFVGRLLEYSEAPLSLRHAATHTHTSAHTHTRRRKKGVYKIWLTYITEITVHKPM